jgi:hypothetical protein
VPESFINSRVPVAVASASRKALDHGRHPEQSKAAPPRTLSSRRKTFSILMALGGAVAAIAFFWLDPTFEHESYIAWAIPGWIAGTYLFAQILFLLVSAAQIRALGVLDSMIAILPVVVGFIDH